MSDIIENHVGSVGNTFFSEVLGKKGSSLALALKEAALRGRWFAAIPRRVAHLNRLDLDEGGKKNKNPIDKYVLRELSSPSSAMKPYFYYVYDPQALPTDPYPEIENVHRITNHEDVVYLPLSNIASYQMISKIIRACVSFYTVIVFTRLNRLEVEESIASGNRKVLEDSTTLCMINAFDQDGVLVMRRDPY